VKLLSVADIYAELSDPATAAASLARYESEMAARFGPRDRWPKLDRDLSAEERSAIEEKRAALAGKDLMKPFAYPPADFRAESRTIGEGVAVADVRPPAFPDLQAMLDEAIFISDGSQVTLRSDPRTAWAWADFQKLTAGLTEAPTGLKGRPRKLSAAWLEHPHRATVYTRTFKPGDRLFCKSPDDEKAVNTWREPPRIAVPTDWMRRAEPFFKHVRFLVRDPVEFDLFCNWLAHIEQRPGELPHWHWLWVTPTQGMGRNLVASVLARVWPGVVALDVDLPALLDGGFNGRLSRKIFATVNEIREGAGPHAYRHADRLRTLLTDETRLVNPKYGRQSIEFNVARWLMFSNNEAAIPLDRFDRRVVVVRNPDAPRPTTYYAGLYALARDPAFIASVRESLRLRDISRFQVGMHAPLTAAKQAVIDASASEADLIMRELAATYPADVISGEVLAAELFGPNSERAERTALRWVAGRAGAVKYPKRITLRRRQLWVWVLRKHGEWLSAGEAAVAAEVARGEDRFRAGNALGN
jgi:hypothetical protein